MKCFMQDDCDYGAIHNLYKRHDYDKIGNLTKAEEKLLGEDVST